MKQKTPLFLAIILLVFSLVVAACNGRETAQAPLEIKKIKVLSMPYLSFSPFFIAQEEGYFKEQALEVEFVNMDSLSQAIPALVNGELNVVSGHIRTSLFNAIAGGQPIKIVADKGYVNATGCSDTALLARKTLVEQGKLADPSGLDGLNISVDVTNYEGYFLDRVLGSAGLTLDDIVLAEDIPSPVQSDALGSGSVDVIFSSEPWLTRILSGGNAVLWIASKDVIPDFQYGVIAFGPSLLKSDPDAGKRFMIAYLKGVQQYNQGKTDRNLEILSKYTGLDKEILNASCWPSFRQDGIVNQESMVAFQKWAVQKGFQDSIVSVDKFWDPEFINEARLAINSSKP